MSEISGHIDVYKLYEVLGEILSEEFDMKIIYHVRPKEPDSSAVDGKNTA